ncbi:delta 1-pyrroline-5-carboxylate reductase [Lambiella insularis]|nr:delta 1-pyrroline-5-carboxylate reductase [Lambiella insularis]
MTDLHNGKNSGRNEGRGMTLTVLGCGTLGTCILSGILSSLSDLGRPSTQQSLSGFSTPSEDLPEIVPSRFIACVTSSESAKRIEKALSTLTKDLTIFQNENVRSVHEAGEAGVVLLGCKPQKVKSILSVPGMRDALQGKLLISILAGVPVAQIEHILYGDSTEKNPDLGKRCRVVRALPNTASILRESMTVIATSTPPLPPNLDKLVTWMFTRIGQVRQVDPSHMDVCTALCGSGPAFFSLFMEAITDGAVAMGLPRIQAQFMAAQAMKGTAAMVLSGEHPAILRDKVSTPGGCTIGGLLVLEEGRVRGTAARCVTEATVKVSKLGRGEQDVNGTRS